MLSASHRSGEEKLGLILGQMAAVRARLNSLAWQGGIFPALAILIAAAVLTFVAAVSLGTGAFLAILIVCAIGVPLGLLVSARAVWLSYLSAERAAALADERADLKGRLAAIHALAEVRRRPALWRYLIEDTAAHSESFVPARVERRLVSRTIYALLAACVFAAIALPLALGHRRATLRQEAAAATARGQITLDLKDLHLLPAAPGGQNGVEVYADAATMRRLDEQAARQGIGSGGASAGGNPFSRLVSHAGALAGRLQSRLSGRHAERTHLRLKLADAGNQPPSSPASPIPKADSGPTRTLQDFQFKQHQDFKSGPNIPVDPHLYQNQRQAMPAGMALANPSAGAGLSANTSSNDTGDQSAASKNGAVIAGGASHGVGASPDNLFGPPETPALGGEGFAITIQARQAARGGNNSGQTYVPPKVTVPLNSKQFPDEPVARASVPPRDRLAVKRVFER